VTAVPTIISARPNKTRLTDRGIRALRPDARRTIDYADTEVPGLRVRVTPAGVKSFGLRFDWQGRTRRKDYGRCFVELSLEKARELARADRQRLRDGIDPTAPSPSSNVPTFAQVAERWRAAKQANGHRRAEDAYRLLQRYAMPSAEAWPDLPDRAELSLADRPINAIDRKAVARILEWVRDRCGLKATVNKVQKTISGVFTYALNAGDIKGHPLAGMALLIDERERERTLSIDELITVWQACDQLGAEAAGCVRTLILTAQRRSEVSGLRRREIVDDGATWLLPAARRKQDNKRSKKDHAVPLSAAARAVIAAMPSWLPPNADHLFGVNGERPYGGWRKAAKKLQKTAGLTQPWTIHDLRRSVSTLWGDELNAPWEIVHGRSGTASRAGSARRRAMTARRDGLRSASYTTRGTNSSWPGSQRRTVTM
jgi:integrase